MDKKTLELKGTRKVVDLQAGLISSAVASMSEPDSDRPPNRDVITKSVDQWLPIVLALVRAAGGVEAASGKRRPRNFHKETWDQLEAIKDLQKPLVGYVDMSLVGLLRACLTLQAENGDDVERFLSAIVENLTTDAKKIRSEISEFLIKKEAEEKSAAGK